MQHATKSTMPLRAATLTLLTHAWLILSTGCKTRVVVLSEDRAVLRLKQGQQFVPERPGYFIPDARMLEILNQLQDRVEALPK